MGGRTRPVQPMPDDIREELESSGRMADQRARGRPAGAWPTSGRMADQRAHGRPAGATTTSPGSAGRPVTPRTRALRADAARARDRRCVHRHDALMRLMQIKATPRARRSPSVWRTIRGRSGGTDGRADLCGRGWLASAARVRPVGGVTGGSRASCATECQSCAPECQSCAPECQSYACTTPSAGVEPTRRTHSCASCRSRPRPQTRGRAWPTRPPRAP